MSSIEQHIIAQRQPYTRLQICPKCLREDIHLSYHTYQMTVYNHGPQPPDLVVVEYILCTCLRCAYQWAMEPADARHVV